MSHPSEEMVNMPVGKILSLTGMQAVLFCAIGLGLWWLAGRDLMDFVTFDLRQLTLGLGIAAGFIMLGYVLFHGFPRFGERLVRDQVQQFAFLKKRLGLGSITVLSAYAGIGEEALFRGGLLTVLDVYAPFPIALILSAGVFTAIHFAKPTVAIFIFVIGSIFGLIFWVSGSLLAVMIGHWVYDIWALWFIQKEMHRLGVFDEDNALDAPEQVLGEDKGVAADD